MAEKKQVQSLKFGNRSTVTAQRKVFLRFVKCNSERL